MLRKVLIWGTGIVLSIAGIVLLGILFMMGPRNVWGMMRFDQRREGSLSVGEKAPDVELQALDGITKEKLWSRLHGRPLVLIFGSYT